MDKLFADYTKKIIDKLPYWFKMKKSPQDSIGALFLNVIGLEFEQIEYILDYAYKQTNIYNMDVDFLDITYKCILPNNITKDKEVKVYTNNIVLNLCNSVNEFFISANNNMIHPELYYDNPCYIDYDKHILYTKNAYNQTAKKPYGQITIEHENNTYDIDLNINPVWNFFDEFGLLLNCTRVLG